ncbi:MAG: UbiA family prenyltransferase [Planctomycetota bacterium]|jgi:1,4-dihydroxy-2-naphthoate octaprenyltransferase
MKLKIWFLETRPQFLVLSVILVLLGTAISWNEGHFDGLRFVLTAIGLVLAHASVNVLNDYSDYKSGIDLETKRTPFSGGSGILPQKLLQPEAAYKFGLGCLLVALLIGIYLAYVSGWQLLPLIILGGPVIYSYTSHLTKWVIGELWAGLGLGTLPVLGTYFVQTGHYSVGALVASLAPGFLTANLLFLNEFPDVVPDKKGGRYHMVIALGTRRAGWLYALLMAITYLCVLAGVVSKLMPALSFIAFLSIPFAVQAIRAAFKHHDNPRELVPALKANVLAVLSTDALLALAYLLDSFR